MARKTKAKAKAVDNEPINVEGIIANGFENGMDEDGIKAELFRAGVPFADINKVYKEAAIAGGFIPDPAKVKAAVAKYIDVLDVDAVISMTDYAEVQDVIADMMEQTDCTERQAAAALRKLFTDNDAAMPKKPRGSGGGARRGKIAEAILDMAKEKGGDFTKQDMYEAVMPVVKGPKNAADVTHYFFNVVYGAVNGMNLDEVLVATKDEPYPTAEANDAEEDEG